MTDHVKPTLWEINLDHTVLHAGMNDLRTENTASQIANAVRSYGNTVTVPGIVPRHDE